MSVLGKLLFSSYSLGLPELSDSVCGVTWYAGCVPAWASVTAGYQLGWRAPVSHGYKGPKQVTLGVAGHSSAQSVLRSPWLFVPLEGTNTARNDTCEV